MTAINYYVLLQNESRDLLERRNEVFTRYGAPGDLFVRGRTRKIPYMYYVYAYTYIHTKYSRFALDDFRAKSIYVSHYFAVAVSLI